MEKLRRLVAGALAAGLTSALLVFGPTHVRPALGEELPPPGGGCSTGPFHLEVVHEPRMFHYFLYSGGDKNNVNIRIYDAGNNLLWSWNSPDDRKKQTWYHIQPAVQVPTGGYATFKAIFDQSVWSDPSCTYTTPVCCSPVNRWAPNGGTALGPWGWSPPYMTRNGLQVTADLYGHSTFEWVIKASGLPDNYFLGGATITVPQSTYGAKTVRVSAQVPGSGNWASPEVTFFVPPL